MPLNTLKKSGFFFSDPRNLCLQLWPVSPSISWEIRSSHPGAAIRNQFLTLVEGGRCTDSTLRDNPNLVALRLRNCHRCPQMGPSLPHASPSPSPCSLDLRLRD